MSDSNIDNVPKGTEAENKNDTIVVIDDSAEEDGESEGYLESEEGLNSEEGLQEEDEGEGEGEGEGAELGEIESTDEEEEDDDQIDSFREAFLIYSNPDNTINPVNVRPCLEILGISITDDALQQVLSDYPVNNDGALDYDSFVAISGYGQSVRNAEDEILNAFRTFDNENRGFLTSEELQLVLTMLDGTISPEEADQIVHLVVSRDGKFYYEPFVKQLKEMGLFEEL